MLKKRDTMHSKKSTRRFRQDITTRPRSPDQSALAFPTEITWRESVLPTKIIPLEIMRRRSTLPTKPSSNRKTCRRRS
eukprot:3336379-Pyramimonas_sp.AAC.1